ncbi:beta-lactamase transpeptidase-like protein [Sistotremastrum niveocremeum HHB9708]|uniref:Beta-lactamase transpeptidase-like protein n=2 Tax=Sistotremastraceae TaxID=3402574 RepID=A0A164NI11_9AGAM|nr:beta-lactamase transpeptidase-like protein [Sistotremastrum niveocremeum HHB9708]KZT35354.1 beta-lactamase [Sistotremastrum suecicum HHB10207 ss-3]
MSLSSVTKTKIDNILKAATEQKNGIPGIIYAAVDRKGNTIYEGAAGVKSLKNPDEKLTLDTVFWIASFTKLVTTIAALQLVEQGKLSLDAPIDPQILPEVTNAKLVEGQKGSLTYHEPKNKITLKLLLTHTAGFAYTVFNHTIREWAEETNAGDEFTGKPEGISGPLVFEPGEDWQYAIGIDWAGALVEGVTGKTLSEYFKDHIFQPLGLTSTDFGGPLHEKLAGLHSRDEEGNLVPRDYPAIVRNPLFFSGGAGLLSIASDYLKILTALINDGVGANGTRILKSETVELMFQDAVPQFSKRLNDPIPAARADHTNVVNMLPGVEKGWGLSFLLNKAPLPTGRGAYSAFWAGIANCYWTADRENGVASVVFTQIFPFSDPLVLDTWTKAEFELYQGLNAASSLQDSAFV